MHDGDPDGHRPGGDLPCLDPLTEGLDGKVERSHRTDQEEFYPLLDYVDDRDLNKKLAQWEPFYNLTRRHGGSVAEPRMRHSENVYNRVAHCPTSSCTSHFHRSAASRIAAAILNRLMEPPWDFLHSNAYLPAGET